MDDKPAATTVIPLYFLLAPPSTRRQSLESPNPPTPPEQLDSLVRQPPSRGAANQRH